MKKYATSPFPLLAIEFRESPTTKGDPNKLTLYSEKGSDALKAYIQSLIENSSIVLFDINQIELKPFKQKYLEVTYLSNNIDFKRKFLGIIKKTEIELFNDGNILTTFYRVNKHMQTSNYLQENIICKQSNNNTIWLLDENNKYHSKNDWEKIKKEIEKNESTFSSSTAQVHRHLKSAKKETPTDQMEVANDKALSTLMEMEEQKQRSENQPVDSFTQKIIDGLNIGSIEDTSDFEVQLLFR